MRSSTHSTSASLRTPRATLMAGRPCHSLVPTHRLWPAARAAAGGGRAQGERRQRRRPLQRRAHPLSAHLLPPAPTPLLPHPRHVLCAPWRARRPPPPRRPWPSQRGLGPPPPPVLPHRAHTQLPCRTRGWVETAGVAAGRRCEAWRAPTRLGGAGAAAGGAGMLLPSSRARRRWAAQHSHPAQPPLLPNLVNKT